MLWFKSRTRISFLQGDEGVFVFVMDSGIGHNAVPFFRTLFSWTGLIERQLLMRAEIQKDILESCRRVIVKIGSSTLTKDDGLHRLNIHRIGDQLADIRAAGVDVLVVSSGAVAAGIRRMGRTDRPRTIPQKQAAAAIGQGQLMQAWEDAFDKHELRVAQLLLTAQDLRTRERYLNARYTIDTLFGWGVIPVVNENDTVAVDEIKFGDNDQLAAWMAGLIGADLVIILTDTEGLYDNDPRKVPDAQLIPLVETIDETLIEATGGTSSMVGTGGMRSKLMAASKCMELGVPMLVLSGQRRDILLELFAGETPGTLFVPSQKRPQSKKWWLARLAQPEGVLHLDAGASHALRQQGRSVLPVGITHVEGVFGEAACVQCVDEQGVLIGHGLCNYPSTEVQQIKGHRSDEIENILGYKYADEVIHRDHFVLANEPIRVGEA